MNPPDNYAIEEAMLIKEKVGAGEVVIVSMGPQRVQKVIREGLSKGADRGIHIETESLNEIDPLYISKVLAETLRDENFDLILSGLQSDDSGMGQTGVLLGELLNMSTATLAIETDIDQNKIRVKRELESGWFQWVELESPASVSIQSGINQPRYPSLKGIMGAKKKEIKVIPAPQVEKRQSISEIFVPKKSKETEFIETDIDSTVERIIEILKTEVKVF
jgi:electron transfer flavoprotein beta subunit